MFFFKKIITVVLEIDNSRRVPPPSESLPGKEGREAVVLQQTPTTLEMSLSAPPRRPHHCQRRTELWPSPTVSEDHSCHRRLGTDQSVWGDG